MKHLRWVHDHALAPTPLPVDSRISSKVSRLKLSLRTYDHLANLSLLAVFRSPLIVRASFFKSMIDRSLAAVLIVLLSPILLLTALAVRLDSRGPGLQAAPLRLQR